MKAGPCNPISYAIRTTPYIEQPVRIWDQLCAVARVVKFPFRLIGGIYSWLTEKNPKPLPPCAPGHGLLGSIPELAVRDWNIIRLIHDYEQEYGEEGLCEIKLGTKPIYIVSCPDIADTILNDPNYIRGPTLRVWREFSKGGLSEGKKAKNYRIQAVNALAPKKLIHYFPGIVRVADAWLERLSTFERDGKAFDLFFNCQRATLAAIGSTLLSRDQEEPNPFGLATEDDVDCDRFLEAFHRLFELMTKRITSGVANFPLFGDTLYSKLHRKEEEEFSTAKNTLKEILEPIFKHLLRNDPPIDRKSVFYENMTNFKIDVDNPNYPKILDRSLGFLQASFETSSKALGWALYHLARDQELQEELRGAILTQLGGRKPNNIGDLKIPLLEQLTEETLRLFPPFPFIPRDIQNADNFPTFKVKQGGTFLISPLLIQRKEKVWGENAECFDPEHFASEDARSDKLQKDDPNYLTFNRGPHQCPGRNLAKHELKTLIALFLQKYQIRLENPDEQPVGLKFNITLQPEKPILVMIDEIKL